MKKILLDTDIGSDIDDAFCLAYLLCQKDCELLGVSTVSGEPEKRAELASAVCKNSGREVPIYIGCENPLLVSPLQPKAQQYEKIDKWAHNTEFPRIHSVEFLREKIEANPNEVTLLAIGPMTNIALLFSMYPHTAELIKELVIMCGYFYPPKQEPKLREWNVMCDPHAAQIVYNAPVNSIRLIGLDVTFKCQMDKAEAREKCKAKALAPVMDFVDIWFEKNDLITYHDPLAAAVIFDDDICKFESGNVSVELGEKDSGFTYWTADNDGRIKIAREVDTERFFSHYFGTIY